MSLLYIKDNKIIKNDNNSIDILKELSVHKDDIITSSIDIKDVITYTLKLPKSTTQEELKSQAEMQFFENSGLDLNKQYVTKYIVEELEAEDSYLIEAIAIEEEILHKKFAKVVEKTTHIDFISLSVLAFSEFYKSYDVEAKKDAFVYLDNEQSFIAVYRDGEYLYSKTLNSLNSLLKATSLDYDKFVEIISTKGVNKENYEMDDFLLAGEIEKFFDEYFMAINNRISYGKTIFYLDNIDNVYFYTPFEIKEIDKLKTFWDLSGINFEVIPNEEINFLDKLVVLYNTHNFDNDINFSVFPRPPKFYKTRTFALIMAILLTILVFGGDFAYRDYENTQLENNLKSLTTKIKVKQAKYARLQIINKAITDELNKTNTEISRISKKKKEIKLLVEKTIELVNNHHLSNDMILFSKLLKKNNLKLYTVDYNSSTFKLGVYTKSKKRKFIANFMMDLSKNHYKNVQTDNIQILGDGSYTSLIRFEK